MQAELHINKKSYGLRQISVYADNKVGKLNDIVKIFSKQGIHLMAFCFIDTTDSGLLRTVVNYTERAIEILKSNGLTFNITEVLGLETKTQQSIQQITGALMEAEINIHYFYPFIMRPQNNSGLVLRLEDIELAANVLKRHNFNILSEHDISR